MAGTHQGGTKAAETLHQKDPNFYSNIGHKGAEARNEKYSHEDRSEISKRAAETRKEHDPDAFKKMGQKGGSSSRKTS